MKETVVRSAIEHSSKGLVSIAKRLRGLLLLF